MDVTTAVLSRKSTRAFLPDPVPKALIAEILETAARAPSGGNLQPWHVFVLSGEPLQRLKDEIQAKAEIEPMEFDIYPANLWEPFRTRRYQNAEDLYGSIGLVREDKAGRLRQLARNAQMFGAPVGVFIWIDRDLGKPQWADLGMFMQNVMLLAKERGLDSCPQEFWGQYPLTLAKHLGAPDNLMMFAGIALGWSDPDHAINRMESRRDALETWCDLKGFDEA